MVRPSRRRRCAARPLALLLACLGLLLVPAGAATARITAPAPVTAGADGPVLLARAGAGTHSFGGSRRTYGSRGYGSRSYGFGRRSNNHSFLRGLFVGWTLGHFFGFGGGIPLFPLLFLLLLFLLLRRGGGGRRPPRRRSPWLQR